MKRKNKILTAILAATVICSSLVGCGSSESTQTTVAETTVSEKISVDENKTSTEETTKSADKEEYVTVVDHNGRNVTVKTDPESVVITGILPLPSVLTVYLGSAQTIKAMEPASMNAAKNSVLSELYPEILNSRTDIMNGDNVNVESILEINPDVVFANFGEKALIEQLEQVGIPVVAISPTKFNYDCIVTYNEWIALLDQIYPSRAAGVESTVDTYSNKIYDIIQEKTSKLKDEERQKVLFLFQYSDTTMVTSGSSFFGQWWCDAVGALNAANEVAADNSNAVITMEQVYEWNPDVIIITNFTPAQPEDLYNNAIGGDDWSSVKAVMDRRVYKMPLGTYRTYTPGVDTPMTLKWLAQAVYPELFDDIDVTKDVKDYYNVLYGINLTDEQISNMYNPNSAAGQMK